MLPPGPRFPDAFVGLPPPATDCLTESDEHPLRRPVEAAAAAREFEHRVDDLPVRIELQLAVCSAFRARAAAARSSAFLANIFFRLDSDMKLSS